MGILLCASLLDIPKVVSIINPDKAIPAVLPESIDRIIEITKIFPDQVKNCKNYFYRN
jgi:protein TonB